MNTAKIATGASLAAALFLAGLGTAVAVPTVTVLGQSTQGAGNTAGIAYATNYNGTTPTGAAWSNTNVLVTPPPVNQSGVYQSPFNNTNAANESKTYFSVGGTINGEGAPSPVTLSFGLPQSSFTLLWGSIDTYNTLTFVNTVAATSWSFTGTDIANLLGLPAPDANGNYEHVALLDFNWAANCSRACGQFNQIQFSSSQAAFEFALPTQVPEPTALALMGLGLLGAGFARRRAR